MASPPTTELGSQSPPTSVLPWGAFVHEGEHIAELTWPNSIATYNLMRTDAQVKALLQAMTAPVRRYRWLIDPNGARPEIVKALSADLGLDVRGEDPEPRGRSQGSFSHDKHLFHALLALVFGYAYFEQVGTIIDGQWRLRKLAYRPAETIQQIQVAGDGGLVAIQQNIAEVGKPAPLIPVDRLVAFIWEQEGGNWVGTSMLRPLYKHWIVKDRLLRVDAVKHERNGLGVPTIEAPPNASPQQMVEFNRLAQSYKAGESSGGALPNGARLRLVGTEGSLPDTLASIRYHDEQMARALLLMFIQLGQTQTGSRALGESFVDFFALAQETLANWYASVMTEHVLEDWVTWNYGEDEQAPLLTWERNEDPELSVADLKALVDAGAIVVDEELRSTLRERYGLPEEDLEEPEPQPSAPEAAPASPPGPPLPERPQEQQGVEATSAHARRVRRVKAASGTEALVSLPPRALRRQPYEHEVTAAVDYAALDAQWVHATDALLREYQTFTQSQRDALLEQIVQANGSLAKLSAISAEPVGTEAVHASMVRLANSSAQQALQEAAKQGRVVAPPNLEKVEAALLQRAEATTALLARSISEAAARKAIQLTAPTVPSEAVAQGVAAHLASMSEAYLRDQFGGALTAAQNDGRKATMREAEPSRIYASELLDGNTCENCIDIDGTEYDSVDEAEADYPTGGYSDCLGGPRCRGTLVAVYDETPQSG